VFGTASHRTADNLSSLRKWAPMSEYDRMSREELLEALKAFAKHWLAHDGCWFLAAEERFGLETAIELDTAAWRRFAAAEARRIAEVFKIPTGGGLQALARALSLRMYAVLNEQHVEWAGDGRTLRFFMDGCRVQDTRRRKGLPDFPCRSVGDVEFSAFARAIDPRIVTRCIHCPPDPNQAGACTWEFSLTE
jgi:hypothetical protein